MVQQSKNLHRETMAALQMEYKSLLKGYIPFSTDVEKMGVHRAPVLTYAGKDQASIAYRTIWSDIEKKAKITLKR